MSAVCRGVPEGRASDTALCYLLFPPTPEQPQHQGTVLALSPQDLTATLRCSVKNRLQSKPQAARPPSIVTTGLQKAGAHCRDKRALILC